MATDRARAKADKGSTLKRLRGVKGIATVLVIFNEYTDDVIPLANVHHIERPCAFLNAFNRDLFFFLTGDLNNIKVIGLGDGDNIFSHS